MSSAPEANTASNAPRVYETSAPSIQNALDIFAGEWTTKLPGALGEQYRAGQVPLCDDPRVRWAVAEMGGVDGMRILELGPLEGAHTYMLEKSGAAEVLAIEANRRAYLRSLVMQDILGLKSAKFLCGDFMEYLRSCTESFDLCFASGVLYHLVNPVELIARAAATADRFYLWTHYFDPRLSSRKSSHFPKFPHGESLQFDGFPHTLHRFEYQSPLEFPRFIGGTARHSHWMTRDDILRCIRHFGFDDIRVGFEQPDHDNGPAFSVVAMRSQP